MIRTRGRMLEPTKGALRAELALAREQLDDAMNQSERLERMAGEALDLANSLIGAAGHRTSRAALASCAAAFALGLLAGVIW